MKAGGGISIHPGGKSRWKGLCRWRQCGISPVHLLFLPSFPVLPVSYCLASLPPPRLPCLTAFRDYTETCEARARHSLRMSCKVFRAAGQIGAERIQHQCWPRRDGAGRAPGFQIHWLPLRTPEALAPCTSLPVTMSRCARAGIAKAGSSCCVGGSHSNANTREQPGVHVQGLHWACS